MTRKNFFKFGIISLCIGIFLLAFTYFFYHFATDAGISLVWHKEIGKPFVTMLLGFFSVLFVWSGAISFLVGAIFCKKDN